MDAQQALRRSEVRERARSGRARELRQQRGLSIAEVADVVGVSQASISRWESGACSPKGEAADRYGHFLDLLERGS